MSEGSPRNLHVAWSRLFVRGLVSAGVTDVVVSPGSRSTPLALAVAEEPRLRAHVVVDERSAGFFALGLARRAERAVALLCTSGTAGAHYFPALLEASEAHVPLVVITADRPWEAYGNASSQTMDQAKLFGDHVRAFAELGLPDPSPSALRAVARIAVQAVAQSQWPVPGPVHVNARFRKPLEPEGAIDEAAWPAPLRALLADAPPAFVPPRQGTDVRAVERLLRAVEGAPSGIVALGPMPPSAADARASVERFASRAGFAVLAETTSQHRRGFVPSTGIAAFDAVLRVPALRDAAPGLFIEIGRPLVSSAYLAYRERHAGVPALRLAAHGWPDPTNAADMLLGPVSPLLDAVAARLASRPISPFFEALRTADRVAAGLVEGETCGPTFTEGQAIATLLARAPGGATLLVGNSSPVRDLDLYGGYGGVPLTVLHQRGVAGIDGLVAGALGAAASDGDPSAPVIVLLGDVSLAHDLGSLVYARAVPRPVVIVVLDNGGGRIFGELPIADRVELSATFERFFTTPTGLDFAAIAAALGLAAAPVASRGELDRALADALRVPRTTVVVAHVATAQPSPRRVLAERLAAALSLPGAHP